jgi:hypothetical protein
MLVLLSAKSGQRRETGGVDSQGEPWAEPEPSLALGLPNRPPPGHQPALTDGLLKQLA